jgi:hypothetical protein
MIARQEDVQSAIRVIVADGTSGPVAGLSRESAFGRHVVKIAGAQIPVQPRAGTTHKQDILPAVAVSIECRAATPKGMQRRHRPRLLGPDMQETALSGDIDKANPRSRGHQFATERCG